MKRSRHPVTGMVKRADATVWPLPTASGTLATRQPASETSYEERYRIVSELTSDYAYAYVPVEDGCHIFEWVTAAFEQRCGFTLQELNAAGWAILVHPDDMPAMLSRKQRLDAGMADVREFRVVTKAGEIRWVLDHAMPILEGREVRRVYGAAKDITAQKATLMALQASEHKNAEIARLVPVVIYQTDAEGQVIYVNERWSQFTGLPLERCYGDGWKAALHPEDVERFSRWQHHVKQGETFTAELRYLKPNGTIVWAYLWAEPQFADDGTPTGFIGTVADISDRKRAEEKLVTQAAVLANMAEGVIVTDEAGRIIIANAATQHIYGYAEAELLGKPAWELKAALEPDTKALTARIIAALVKHGSWTGEFAARRKSGEVRTLAARMSCIWIAGRRYFVSVGQDVTDLRKAEELRLLLSAIVHSTDDAIIGKLLDGTIVSWNPAAEAVYGYTSEEMCGRSVSLLFPKDKKDTVREIQAILSQGRSLKNLETQRVRKDGTIIDVSLTLSPIKDATGKVIGAAEIARDITAQKKAEANLRLWGRAIEASSNGIMIVDIRTPEMSIVYVNAAFQQITGYTLTEVQGRNPKFLSNEDNAQPGLTEIRIAVREQREGRATLRNYRKDGQCFWNELSIAPVPDADGRVTHFIWVVNDITDRRRYEAELEYQATHDVLTRLPNRRLLAERLKQAISRAQHARKMAAVFFVNLDRFKFVNDSISHDAGDQVLCEVSQRLCQIFRDTDTVARQGGDDFVVVAERIDRDEATAMLARRIMQALSAPFELAGQSVYVGCSVGIGLYPKDGITASDLLKNAGAAMYRAKELGRANFQFYSPAMNIRTRERLEIENTLHNALERNEFILHYQPQVDLISGTVVGVEALIRWKHPTLGLILPARFIGVAEETGLIEPIGAWVLRTACAQARAWQIAGRGDIRVTVNLSARQFMQCGLADLVATVIAESGLAPRLLNIELTENLVMTEVERAVCVLDDLRALGVQLSIDDFGTGHSSLSYLKRFPIDMLKIAQAFVHEISPHSNDAAIANAIISLAHSLGIRVIATGVETEAQCAFLSRNMCDEMQGFLFSEALPAEEVEPLLRNARLPDTLLRAQKPPRTLLLVDDEPNILSALKRLVRRDNYKVLVAASGKDGLELLTQNKVDVIVSDQRMPGMTGVEFLRTVKMLYPETVRIVLSGFTELQSVTDAVNEGAIYKFLTKPWDDIQLREHIAQAFEHKEMVDENHRLDLQVRSANQELAKANRQLEEVLRQKQQQIKHDAVTIDIVHEALQQVPLPMIGLDEDEIVVFINVAAQALFREMGSVLGLEAAHLMPGLLNAVHQVAEGEKCIAELDGMWFDVSARRMGKGTQSRGNLITLTHREQA